MSYVNQDPIVEEGEGSDERLAKETEAEKVERLAKWDEAVRQIGYAERPCRDALEYLRGVETRLAFIGYPSGVVTELIKVLVSVRAAIQAEEKAMENA